MSHMPRRRLGSVSDSAPPSDYSEGSETFEIVPDWSVDTDHHHGNRNNGLFIDTDSENRNDSLSSGNSGIISDNERVQVESFFSGLGTEVFVCSSLANLYESVEKGWQLIYTGIPVLLHDKGSARSRGIPKVKFILAERGSCFALWSDIIDNLSDYKTAGPTFHTMCLSIDHTKLIGFSYDSSQAAREVWKFIEKLTSDFENIALNIPGNKKNKQKQQNQQQQQQQQQKRVKPQPLPPKSQISHPCQFNHITNVTVEDRERYFSLQAFVPKPSKQRDY